MLVLLTKFTGQSAVWNSMQLSPSRAELGIAENWTTSYWLPLTEWSQADPWIKDREENVWEEERKLCVYVCEMGFLSVWINVHIYTTLIQQVMLPSELKRDFFKYSVPLILIMTLLLRISEHWTPCVWRMPRWKRPSCNSSWSQVIIFCFADGGDCEKGEKRVVACLWWLSKHTKVVTIIKKELSTTQLITLTLTQSFNLPYCISSFQIWSKDIEEMFISTSQATHTCQIHYTYVTRETIKLAADKWQLWPWQLRMRNRACRLKTIILP